MYLGYEEKENAVMYLLDKIGHKEGRNITDQLEQVLSILESRSKQGSQSQD